MREVEYSQTDFSNERKFNDFKDQDRNIDFGYYSPEPPKMDEAVYIFTEHKKLGIKFLGTPKSTEFSAQVYDVDLDTIETIGISALSEKTSLEKRIIIVPDHELFRIMDYVFAHLNEKRVVLDIYSVGEPEYKPIKEEFAQEPDKYKPINELKIESFDKPVEFNYEFINKQENFKTKEFEPEKVNPKYDLEKESKYNTYNDKESLEKLKDKLLDSLDTNRNMYGNDGINNNFDPYTQFNDGRVNLK